MWGLQEQKRSIFIFCNEKSLSWNWMDALPSRFINEIPDESVEKNELDMSSADEFEFNQDTSIEFDEEYEVQGGIALKRKKC